MAMDSYDKTPTLLLGPGFLRAHSVSPAFHLFDIFDHP